MNKPELIKIALEQLTDQFKVSPESFDYIEDIHDNTIVLGKMSAILWEPKIELNGDRIEDPNNYKSIVITFNDKQEEMACYIFSKGSISKSSSNVKYDLSKFEACTKYTRYLERYRSNYKKFKRLSDLIIQRDRRKEHKDFLTKLYGIFPGTMDKHLFGE